MKFNVIVEEDSVTPYLNDIENRLYASKQEILYEVARRFEEEATSRAPVWQGNLVDSVADPDAWQLFTENDFMQLDIVFSGTAHEDEGDQWWAEFRDSRFPNGGRDYALFQETGVDWYAKSKYAKHKGYVRRSTEPTQRFSDEYLLREIKRIIMTE